MTRLAYHFIRSHAAGRATRDEMVIETLAWWAFYAFALYLVFALDAAACFVFWIPAARRRLCRWLTIEDPIDAARRAHPPCSTQIPSLTSPPISWQAGPMSGDPWTRDPVVAARLEQLNDAYARGEIDLDDLERRTADVIERGHRPPRLIETAAGTDHPPATVPASSTRTQANATFSASPRRRAVLAGVIIAIVIGALGAVASSLPNEKIVPDAVGMYPQEAIAAINAAGVRTNSHGGIHEQEGQGFIVCETVPAAGAPLDPDEAVVEIFSRRDCEPKTAMAKAYAREWRSRERGTSDEH